MLSAGREVSRSGLELSDTASGDLQRAWQRGKLSRHEPQSAPEQLRLRVPGHALQFFQQRAIFPAQARKDIRLHMFECSSSDVTRATAAEILLRQGTACAMASDAQLVPAAEIHWWRPNGNPLSK